MHSLTYANMFCHLGLRQTVPHVVRRRALSTLPQPPSLPILASIAVGLPIALWTYKCLMLVLFQRRIIYMGYAPLGARQQRLDSSLLLAFDNIRCSEISLEGSERSKLSGVLVHRADLAEEDIQVVLVYFQGNAGNPVQRVPIFSYLCKSVSPHHGPKIAVLAVAPRSYWKSTPRRPTQTGIVQDYADTLQYALQRFPRAHIVLYGHSLGGAAAICTLAQLQQVDTDSPSIPGADRIRGLVLENPFASIPAMVRALYPQKWLPYHYLAPLAFDKWDSLATLRSHCGKSTVLDRVSRDMLVLLSEHDEIVPPEMGREIFHLATHDGRGVARCVMVPNALHENAWMKKTWIDEMRKYLGCIA